MTEGRDGTNILDLAGRSYWRDAGAAAGGLESGELMDDIKSELIGLARSVTGEFPLRKDFSAGSVGAAIRSASGRIYTGVCLDLGCGLGFCAEVAALAEMLKNRETHVTHVAAVRDDDRLCVAPCGRCRETIAQLDPRNLDCRVILGQDRDVALRDILPEHWLTGLETGARNSKRKA